MHQGLHFHVFHMFDILSSHVQPSEMHVKSMHMKNVMLMKNVSICRGHGFESRSSLNFFSGLIFTTIYITVMIFLLLNIYSAVQIYEFIYSLS